MPYTFERQPENNVMHATDVSSVQLHSVHFRMTLLRPFLLGLTILILLQGGSAQKSEMFETKNLASEIRTRFSLTRRDVRAIDPLLKEENRRTIEIYSRFGGAEADYSGRVWAQLVDDRSQFESKVSGLSNKQGKALRSARSRMEKRLLRYLVEDYVAFLDELLSFDEFEYDDVKRLLESEVEKKQHLLSAHISELSVLMQKMDQVSRDTQAGLRRAMHAEQWHGYTKLTEIPELIG